MCASKAQEKHLAGISAAAHYRYTKDATLGHCKAGDAPLLAVERKSKRLKREREVPTCIPFLRCYFKDGCSFNIINSSSSCQLPCIIKVSTKNAVHKWWDCWCWPLCFFRCTCFPVKERSQSDGSSIYIFFRFM